MVSGNEGVVVVNENAAVINYYTLFVKLDDAMINMHVVNGDAAIVNLVSKTLVVLLEI